MADAEIAKAQFDYLASQVRQNGEPVPYGTFLREKANTQALVCETCGQLPAYLGDWPTLCHDAMDHVKETGHSVVVEETSAAIYGPEE